MWAIIQFIYFFCYCYYYASCKVLKDVFPTPESNVNKIYQKTAHHTILFVPYVQTHCLHNSTQSVSQHKTMGYIYANSVSIIFTTKRLNI
jgi:hypothetical protein